MHLPSHVLVLACVGTSGLLQAQAPIPVRELSAPDAKSAMTFANIFTIRAVANGSVLVNDGLRHQIVLLDSNLLHPRAVLDSVAAGSNSYGTRAAPLIQYVGDSTLFADIASSSLLVLDASGKAVRIMAAPSANVVSWLTASTSGIDNKGNLRSARPPCSMRCAPWRWQ